NHAPVDSATTCLSTSRQRAYRLCDHVPIDSATTRLSIQRPRDYRRTDPSSRARDC
ncbi:hypothetical protein LSAT2_023065, partial [Lamellibrachia satsuma]